MIVTRFRGLLPSDDKELQGKGEVGDLDKVLRQVSRKLANGSGGRRL